MSSAFQSTGSYVSTLQPQQQPLGFRSSTAPWGTSTTSTTTTSFGRESRAAAQGSLNVPNRHVSNRQLFSSSEDTHDFPTNPKAVPRSTNRAAGGARAVHDSRRSSQAHGPYGTGSTTTQGLTVTDPYTTGDLRAIVDELEGRTKRRDAKRRHKYFSNEEDAERRGFTTSSTNNNLNVYKKSSETHRASRDTTAKRQSDERGSELGGVRRGSSRFVSQYGNRSAFGEDVHQQQRWVGHDDAFTGGGGYDSESPNCSAVGPSSSLLQSTVPLSKRESKRKHIVGGYRGGSKEQPSRQRDDSYERQLPPSDDERFMAPWPEEQSKATAQLFASNRDSRESKWPLPQQQRVSRHGDVPLDVHGRRDVSESRFARVPRACGDDHQNSISNFVARDNDGYSKYHHNVTADYQQRGRHRIDSFENHQPIDYYSRGSGRGGAGPDLQPPHYYGAQPPPLHQQQQQCQQYQQNRIMGGGGELYMEAQGMQPAGLVGAELPGCTTTDYWRRVLCCVPD